MRTRLLVATLLVAFGYAPAAHAAPPALAGTTVVTGNGVGSMVVRLTRSTTISLGSTADHRNGTDATFSGNGRLLALALVRGEDETWFVRSGVCMTRGCRATDPRYVGLRVTPEGIDVSEATLPPGTYTLHWVADGAPARVTLRLHGLAGRTTLRPPAARAAVWGPPETQDTVDPVTRTGMRAYAGDTETALRTGGHLLHAQWVRAETMNAHESLCAHGEDETQGPAGCVTMKGASFESNTWMTCVCLVVKTPAEVGIVGWSLLQPGKYVVEASAQYAGTFGDTGYAIAAIPDL